MEGKSVILSVLIVTLVMAQIQVEAKSCCPSTAARNIYNACRAVGRPRPTCAKLSGCKIVDGKCPDGYLHDIHENSGENINEYCKLGCASNVCGALTIFQNSDAADSANEAFEQCTKACSIFCTKGSIAGVDTV